MFVCLGSFCNLYNTRDLEGLDLIYKDSRIIEEKIKAYISLLKELEKDIKKAFVLTEIIELAKLHDYLCKLYTTGSGSEEDKK
jgi:hypothetical protein